MTSLFYVRVAAIAGFLAVSLGAFAAHGLKERLSPEMLAIFETGVKYQFYHALAMLALALGASHLGGGKWVSLANASWLFGMLIFSGSLYILALSGIRWLGAITPIGGLALLAGWVCLLVATFQNTTES